MAAPRRGACQLPRWCRAAPAPNTALGLLAFAVVVAVLITMTRQHSVSGANSSTASAASAPSPQTSATAGPRTTLATVGGIDPDGNRASFALSEGRPIALSRLSNPTLRQSLFDQFPGAVNAINRAVVVPIHAEGGVLVSHSDNGSEDVELTVTQDRGVEGLTPWCAQPRAAVRATTPPRSPPA